MPFTFSIYIVSYLPNNASQKSKNTSFEMYFNIPAFSLGESIAEKGLSPTGTFI